MLDGNVRASKTKKGRGQDGEYKEYRSNTFIKILVDYVTFRKSLTYNKRDADQPERKKSTAAFRHELEIPEDGVQMDWNVLH